jgi:hypothetical protein
MFPALRLLPQELIEDLDGNDNISAQQRAIIDLAVKNKLILDTIERWIFIQPSLIDKRKRAIGAKMLNQPGTAWTPCFVRF